MMNKKQKPGAKAHLCHEVLDLVDCLLVLETVDGEQDPCGAMEHGEGGSSFL